MSYPTLSFEQIRDQYLQALPTGSAIGPDSDHYIKACAQAAVGEGIYSHQAWVYRQIFPDMADQDNMEKHANQRGLYYKAANPASGTVRFNGTVGAPVVSGTVVTTAQGVAFATSSAANIGAGGTVDIASTAVVAGLAGNQTANTPATVSGPGGGVTGNATIIAMTGGDDVESPESLLARLELELSELAQGGNAADYKRWALAVPGVIRAHVFPVRRGAGTVDVVPMPTAGLPSALLLAAVQAAIDAKRPVGLLPVNGFMALAPTALATAVTASLSVASGYTLAGITAQVQAAITAVFSALAPGDTLVRVKLITAIVNVPGVTDVTLPLPAANVTSSVSPTALELITLGAVTLS